MAVKAFEKHSREWMMFKEYWELCRKYWVIENNEGYWDAVAREMGRFAKKYQEEPLARKLAVAFLGSLEEKEKSQA